MGTKTAGKTPVSRMIKEPTSGQFSFWEEKTGGYESGSIATDDCVIYHDAHWVCGL